MICDTERTIEGIVATKNPKLLEMVDKNANSVRIPIIKKDATTFHPEIVVKNGVILEIGIDNKILNEMTPATYIAITGVWYNQDKEGKSYYLNACSW